MNKRKQMSDDLTGSSTATTLPPSKKHLTRHMYTNEQQRFVWYHRDILKMSAKETHKKFYNHYNTNVAVSVDSLNQLAGRLRRIQSPEIVSAKNTEVWALPAGSASAKFSHHHSDITTTNGLSDGCSSGSAESGQGEVESRNGEGESEHGERIIIADTHQSPPSSGPTDPSLHRHRYPRRHMYTPEEHRFVWFHRYHLMMNSSQTHEMFQKTFDIPSVKKDHLNQLAARLWRQGDRDVITITHVEPWAIRTVLPGMMATPRDAEC